MGENTLVSCSSLDGGILWEWETTERLEVTEFYVALGAFPPLSAEVCRT